MQYGMKKNPYSNFAVEDKVSKATLEVDFY